MDIREYKEAFLGEAREYLSTLNNALVSLEKDPADRDCIHAIFRAAHTLKGMSATMGYGPMARLTHQMEGALDPVRQGKTPLTPALTDALFTCLDLLEEWLGVLQTQDAIAEGPLNSVLYVLEGAARGERSLSEGAVPKKARTPDPPVPAPEKAGMPPPMPEGTPPMAAEPVAAPAGPVAPTSTGPSATDPAGPTSPAEGPPNPAAEAPVPPADFPLTESDLAVLKDARADRFQVLHLYLELDPACAFKDVRAFMVLRNLNEIGEIVQSSPAPDDIEKGRFPGSFHLLLLTDKPADEVRSSLMRISEIARVGLEPFRLDEVRPARPEAAPPPDRTPPSPGTGERPAPAASENPRPAVRHEAPVAATSIRVHTSKLDKLMMLVQELVIAKIRFEQVIAGNDLKDLQDPFLNLHHITRDLQDEIMQVRLVPIRQIFDRFPRMVRDLAKRLGKEVQFIMEGAEVELDRTIVDELAEPLVHLLRNAVDHGLETPDDRLKSGKSHAGTVRLVAKRERAYVHISVSDDGRGIDTERVRRKAVSLGVVGEDESLEMTDEEIIRLITLPGMSTVDAATDVSGRGVGVDVAKTKIESLGGTLQIHTRRGHGTVFNLKFPLTLAIIKSLLVRCAGETFAVPVANIVETVDIPPSEIKWVQQQETLLLRDSVVPLYRLQELLAMGRGPAVPVRADGQELIPILSFEVGDYHVGIVVDEVLGQQETAIKSLDRFLKGVRGYSGATILGNGRICLVLDVAGLLEDLVSRRHKAEGRPGHREGADHVHQP
jgi:two-component system chemotaxis sensor kinase CheA